MNQEWSSWKGIKYFTAVHKAKHMPPTLYVDSLTIIVFTNNVTAISCFQKLKHFPFISLPFALPMSASYLNSKLTHPFHKPISFLPSLLVKTTIKILIYVFSYAILLVCHTFRVSQHYIPSYSLYYAKVSSQCFQFLFQ